MSRELKPLDITTIAMGGLVEAANAALAEALGHCQRNPGMAKARKVQIEIVFEHEYHEETDEFSVDISHFVKAVLPNMPGKPDRAKRQPDGTFVVAGSPHIATLESRQMNVFEMRKAEVE